MEKTHTTEAGYRGPADRVTRLGGVPHLTYEPQSDQGEKIDCMDRINIPPKRGTAPARGPPPPCAGKIQIVSFDP